MRQGQAVSVVPYVMVTIPSALRIGVLPTYGVASSQAFISAAAALSALLWLMNIAVIPTGSR
jgi:hypothetical protein